MIRTLSIIGGAGGGPVQLAKDPGKSRNIHVSILNPTAVVHGVWFGRSRRELIQTPTQVGQTGFPVIALPNSVANSTVATVAYTPFILQGWMGELWAVADVDGIIQVDVLDAGSIEK
jgi:hypothetical protein